MSRKLDEKSITLAEVKKILEEKSGDEELSAIEQTTLDYVAKFTKVEAEQARKLVKKLCSEYGLSENVAIQVVNIMPETIEELRTILGKEEKKLEGETVQEILELILKHREE